MTVEENKAVVRRVFEEIWNQGRLDRVDELFAPEYVRHGLPADRPADRDAERQHRAGFREAFPDLVITAEDVVAEGDQVAVRYRWTGTYQGTWPDVPGAGTRVTMTGVAIHRVVAGRITDLWVVGDELGLFRQLGAIPAAPARSA